MSTSTFALIVAIDKYQSDEIHDLHQCFNDAKLFQTYLSERRAILSQRHGSRKRGGNVTVILDSCHSGGGTRRPQDGTPIRCRASRASDRKVPFPDIDKDIWTHEAAFMEIKSTRESGLRGNESHALLSACRDDEFAADGFFTNQLVECLRYKVTAESTYADLATALSFKPNQHPQCEGNGDRVIFDTRIASRDHKTFTLTKREDGKYSVKAWGIHGLRRGTRFKVVDSGALLFVEHIGKISSILLPQIASIPIPDAAVAMALLYEGNAVLKVFLHPPLSIPFEQVKDSSFIIVTIPGDAHLILTRAMGAEGKDRLRVESTDVLFRSTLCHVTYFAWSDVCSSLPRFLDRISYFRYHLGRHRDSDDLDTDLEMSEQTLDTILDHVAIEMFRLGPVTSRGFREPEMPEKNLIYDRAVSLMSDNAFKYGVRLKNTTAANLFFYFFYFDPTDYSIQSWYLPPHHQTAPGPAPETVTVGYGAGGGYPIQFLLEEGKNRDTGFLKVLLSTKYVDMRYMEQGSAAEAPQKLTGAKILETGIWGAWLGAVTVTAPRSSPPHASALAIPVEQENTDMKEDNEGKAVSVSPIQLDHHDPSSDVHPPFEDLAHECSSSDHDEIPTAIMQALATGNSTYYSQVAAFPTSNASEIIVDTNLTEHQLNSTASKRESRDWWSWLDFFCLRRFRKSGKDKLSGIDS
ncbi:hypothetical protein MVEN_02304000 [Mycena venus]|uniref:Uncharacterized protein n=1 Tax=Mycena venus TaxID=2733690 RepID=A0A8H6X4R5_9AGAR|nr:hypothetical protein MVEN_02304000 [Mycena venus]